MGVETPSESPLCARYWLRQKCGRKVRSLAYNCGRTSNRIGEWRRCILLRNRAQQNVFRRHQYATYTRTNKKVSSAHNADRCVRLTSSTVSCFCDTAASTDACYAALSLSGSFVIVQHRRSRLVVEWVKRSAQSSASATACCIRFHSIVIEAVMKPPVQLFSGVV